jgi:uncharacterized protein (DUF983 family)
MDLDSIDNNQNQRGEIDDRNLAKYCPRCGEPLWFSATLEFCQAETCEYQDGWETFSDMYNENADIEYED